MPTGSTKVTNISIGKEILDPIGRTTIELQYPGTPDTMDHTIIGSLMVGKARVSPLSHSLDPLTKSLQCEQMLVDLQLEENEKYAFVVHGNK